jgi:2-methylisocitrate lyase-like PEP mutase family enzyme
LIEINDGAQIIRRVTGVLKDIPVIHLENLGYRIILYKNTKLNADLGRIQSKLGIMESHGKFNKRGKEIQELIA